MIAPQLQPALREIRDHLTNTKVLAVQAAIALLLGQSGPFGTFEILSVLPRMVYWTVVVFVTYASGFVVSEIVTTWLFKHKVAHWLRVAVVGGAVGLVVTLEMYLINHLVFRNLEFPIGLLQTLGVVLPISLVVAALLEFVGTLIGARDATVRLPPTLLDRLPLEKRGPLVSLSVSDHYVDVVTSTGRAMIRMRLGDAIRETAPVSGMQVHRSHWVALDQITSARKTGDTALLKTSQGDEIPVSRSYVKALRETGLLPVAANSAGANG